MRIHTWGIALTFVGFSWGATAHDLAGLMAQDSVLDDTGRKAMQQIEEYEERIAARIAAANGDLSGLEGVVDTALAWKKDVVTVCYFGGQKTAHDLIAELAQTWTKDTRITLDFGPQGNRHICDPKKPSDIRVSFDMAGHWSYVGSVAVVVKKDQPTLNLSGFGAMTSISPAQQGIILHEFGHALAFKHEHQTPVASCDNEFDWDYLYSSLGWPKETVDRNMKKLSLQSTPTLVPTKFDEESVMLYSLGKRAFKDWQSAKCYIPRQNTDISALDRSSIQRLYKPRATAAPDSSQAEAALPIGQDEAIVDAIAGIDEIVGE